ncbi:SURF1 family protein [Thauera sp.]|jgi:cytochrome oxidase assembly protein ShyY1|uniref:SURF1 family protein n=1 Tax=Thauera sp. TaxID=1905334 RepID=UPI002A36F697|nr:SURF1 family protein [Thauera sp.]MDX9886636.1 SURF1 family protein [Thauera sp.]
MAMKLSAFGHRWVLRWRWVLAVLAVAAVPAGLSAWQWQRGAEKEATLARIAQWEREGAVGLARLAELAAAAVRPPMASVDGVQLDFAARWIAPMVWLVDNRIVDRQPGYDVVIAVEDIADVRAAGSSGAAPRAALVNLGWIAAEGGRDALPVPAIPPRLRVQGIFRTDVTGLLLGANVEDHGHWPIRIQQPDPAQLAAWLAVPLAPGLIQQQQASPFHIHYRPVVLPPERHRGYALQWGLIALAVIGVALAASARRLPTESGEIAHEQS